MTFKILRFEPQRDEHPHFQLYRHEPKPQDTVLETLKDIRDQQDPSLAFRYSCREAVCGSCSMVINGRIALACRTQVRDLGSEEVVIEPLPNLEIQKDLIVDLKPFWEAYRRIEPFLQAPGESPEKGTGSKRRTWSTFFNTSPASSAPAATAPARSRPGTGATPGPPPWPSSTDSPSTRETGVRSRRWNASTAPTASGGATPSSDATMSAPRTSGPPTASRA